MAASSGKDMESIGQVVADVNTRLGLTGRPLESVTRKFLVLSRVTGQDVTSMLTEVSKAANDAGIKSGEMGGFLDKLLVASQKTGASISSLSSDMYRYGSPLRQLGFGVDQTIATLGSFDKAGVNTKLVMGSLRIALGKMAKEGVKDLPAALAKGVASIKNAKTGGEAAAKALELFGARAGPDMAAAIREGRFEVADLVKQLQGSSGAVERTGKATQTFSGKMKILRNQATLVGEGFGLIILPYLQKLAAGALGLIKRFQGMSKGTQAVIVKVALFAAAIGPVLVIVGKLTSGIGRMVGVVGKLTLAFGKGGAAAPAWARGVAAVTKGLASFVRQAALAIASVARQAAAWVAETAAKVAATAATVAHSIATKASAAAQWLLNAAMTANPIGLVVAAIAALVAGIVLAWKNNETFRRIVIGVWNAIKTAAVAVWNWLVGAFKKWGTAILIAITGPVGLLVITAIKHWTQDQGRRRAGVVRDPGDRRRGVERASRPSSPAVARHRRRVQALAGRHHRRALAEDPGRRLRGVERHQGAVRRLWSGIVGHLHERARRSPSIGRAIVDGHQERPEQRAGARSSPGSRASSATRSSGRSRSCTSARRRASSPRSAATSPPASPLGMQERHAWCARPRPTSLGPRCRPWRPRGPPGRAGGPAAARRSSTSPPAPCRSRSPAAVRRRPVARRHRGHRRPRLPQAGRRDRAGGRRCPRRRSGRRRQPPNYKRIAVTGAGGERRDRPERPERRHLRPARKRRQAPDGALRAARLRPCRRAATSPPSSRAPGSSSRPRSPPKLVTLAMSSPGKKQAEEQDRCRPSTGPASAPAPAPRRTPSRTPPAPARWRDRPGRGRACSAMLAIRVNDGHKHERRQPRLRLRPVRRRLLRRAADRRALDRSGVAHHDDLVPGAHRDPLAPSSSPGRTTAARRRAPRSPMR